MKMFERFGLATILVSAVTLSGLAGSSPATARNKVVFPQPEGPISTPMSPARKPNDTLRTAGWALPGYCT